MIRLIQHGICLAMLSQTADPAVASTVDINVINRIVDEAFNHGEVIEIAAHLTDAIGPRLPNSPAMREAERWTQGKFREWSLKNVRVEGFDFGRGWWIESSSVRMTAPRPLTLRAIPITWTSATRGTLSASIVVAPMTHERDFAEWRGKLSGKIVLISYPEAPRDPMEPTFKRLSETDLTALDVYRQPVTDPAAIDRRIEQSLLTRKIDQFLQSEGALARVRMSKRDGGLIHGDGYFYRRGDTLSLPAVEIAAEDYRRLARLAKVGSVELQIDSQVHFEDSDPQAYNILADLPGRNGKSDYVLVGAHLDSWVAGDGATDNAAGAAVVMEAARILSKLGIVPRRAIRFALWNAEEVGLRGSFAYVERHIAKWPRPPQPERAPLPLHWQGFAYPVTRLAGYDDLTAYFNLDNGGGKIRGIYSEGNMAVVPILRDWLKPFASMGAQKIVAQPTGGTDHVYFSAVGLPAFQFIQDPLDYFSTTNHSDVDTFDHLRPDDLRQASIVLAATALAAAERDEPLPRNVLPTQPRLTYPFDYRDPRQD